MGNPILEANLRAISKYNPELKYKILQIKSLTNKIEVTNTALQEANLKFNNVVLHSNIGAESEAKGIFAKVNNSKLMLHVLFGFGLGYLFQEFAQKSKGIVLVYEPNLEILASVLEIADFTSELSKSNVFIYSDIAMFKDAYFSKIGYNSETVISFLPSYKMLFEKQIMSFANDLNMLMGIKHINKNFMENKMVPSVKMICSNIEYLVKEPILGEFKDIYAGKTAVIVSAGPSLDENIEILKKYRDRVIIISVAQALRTLMNNGIKPDFFSTIELYNTSSQIDGLDIKDIDLILEPYTNKVMHQLDVKNKILYPSFSSIQNLIWTQIANIDPSEYVSSGTVSITSLYSAKILGFKNIILVGQDLAYIDGMCYSKHASHTGLELKENKDGKVEVVAKDFEVYAYSLYPKDTNLTKEQILNGAQKRLNEINSSLFYVKGIKGNQLPTSVGYASFIDAFNIFAESNSNDLNLYNTSLRGAKIEGFEDKPLEEILKDLPVVERIDLKYELTYDFQGIESNISAEISLLDNILDLMNSANFCIEKYRKEYSNRKIITKKCVDYFKQLLSIYIDVRDTYCKRSKLFFCLQENVGEAVSYEIQKQGGISEEAIKYVFDKLENYVLRVTADLKQVRKILSSEVFKLNEMFNTKS